MRSRVPGAVLIALLASVVGYLALGPGLSPGPAGTRRAGPPPGVGRAPSAARDADGTEPEGTSDDAGELAASAEDTMADGAGSARDTDATDLDGEAGTPDDDTLSEAGRRNREAVRDAERGDLKTAIALLRDAHRLEPATELYRKNLQAALINGAFADIEAERFDAAVPRFLEALGLGDRGEIRRGLGYAYYRLGQLDLARVSLERALEQEAGDGETYVTLGRIYLERHDQERALAMFEKALAAGADPPGLAATVARLRRDAEAEEGYHALASSHFVLKFEGRENAEAGRLVLNGLEEAYRKVGARFAYYPLERLEVILYPDQTFREVTSSPHWSGGVYDGRIKLPVGGLQRGSERLLRTLRHEYAHAAIVTLSHGKAPVWLNEGLAQVAEEAGDEGRGGRLRMALAGEGLLALSELEHGFTRFDREQASLAYAEAYFAADYLLRKKGSYNVRRLLETMATAASTDAAFRQALSQPYSDFERAFLTEVARRVG